VVLLEVSRSSNSKCIVVFYSVPREASLSALFRSLELCGGKAIIVSTARIGDEARGVVEKVRSIGLDIEAFPIFPDEDTSNPEDIARAVNSTARDKHKH